MLFLFTDRDFWGSRFVKWGLDEPVSHFAICHSNGVIYNHTATGFHMDSAKHWQEEYRVVKALRPKLAIDEDEIVALIVDRYRKQGYDFAAIAYFAWRAVLYKFLKRKWPRDNLWSSPKKPLCVGLAREIYLLYPQFFPNNVYNDFDMVSPWKLYLLMAKSEMFEEVDIYAKPTPNNVVPIR